MLQLEALKAVQNTSAELLYSTYCWRHVTRIKCLGVAFLSCLLNYLDAKNIRIIKMAQKPNQQ